MDDAMPYRVHLNRRFLRAKPTENSFDRGMYIGDGFFALVLSTADVNGEFGFIAKLVYGPAA